ncbi:hypothetical protein PVAND_000539 [Polypedilum vanderplanki]|uniref:ABCA1-4-like C-terminal R2 regulatory domain-containing protein n=1 Tax=Polypedilum vanderplanki TaxID=319348 RepID=A0A9J6BLK9_POLVA|nr:hypothetical protein PVAND_000539 [Polypedilum vanderplanki]
MEEVEALCTRLAIMVNGFVLTIKITRKTTDTNKNSSNELIKSESDEMVEERNALKEFVKTEFEGAVLKEEYYDLLTFHVPSHELKWSEIFGILENAKSRLNIED